MAKEYPDYKLQIIINYNKLLLTCIHVHVQCTRDSYYYNYKVSYASNTAKISEKVLGDMAKINNTVRVSTRLN